MILFDILKNKKLQTEPYQWAFIDQLFSPEDSLILSKTYPKDHFKSVNGYDNEKSYVYECRSLVGMGQQEPTFANHLDESWFLLVKDLLSKDYRKALSELSGLDLMSAPMEANIFHYSPGTWMGPHVDLKTKIVTHVFYFNEIWDDSQGGCLSILSSNSSQDVIKKISPITGNSVLIIRSNHSWHAVDPVSINCTSSRRSMTVTFYHPDSVSTMWPPGDIPELHDYDLEAVKTTLT